jgi:hypothetical protein
MTEKERRQEYCTRVPHYLRSPYPKRKTVRTEQNAR